MNTKINQVLIYDDLIAGVITTRSDFYGIWWLYNENDKWLSAGEDIGGDTLLEAEIAFRGKIEKNFKSMQE